MLVWLTLSFKNDFVVFDPSPLTVCIKCSFYIYNNNNNVYIYVAQLHKTLALFSVRWR